MKNKIKIMLAAFAVILIAVAIFVACNKEEVINDVVPSADNVNLKSSEFKFVINLFNSYAITISGKFYRNIKIRPRDGKVCACMDCFGICDFNINGEGSIGPNTTGVLGFDIEKHTANLYLIQELKNADYEFGVDSPYFIPKENLPSSMLEKYSIQKGITILPEVYTYDVQYIGIVYNGDTIPSYGNVQLNISIE